MNEYEVVVTPNVVRIFRVTAESPERAVELIAAGEEERDGEKVSHVKEKEHGYDGRWRLVDDPAVGDFIA